MVQVQPSKQIRIKGSCVLIWKVWVESGSHASWQPMKHLTYLLAIQQPCIKTESCDDLHSTYKVNLQEFSKEGTKYAHGPLSLSIVRLCLEDEKT